MTSKDNLAMFKRFFKYTATSILVSLLYWALLFFLTDVLSIWYMFSAIITAVILTITGFAVNSLWTFKGRGRDNTLSITNEVLRNWKRPKQAIKLISSSRFIRYALVGGCGTLLGWGQLYIYTEYLHLWYMASSVIGTVVVIVCTFVVNNSWTWDRITHE